MATHAARNARPPILAMPSANFAASVMPRSATPRGSNKAQAVRTAPMRLSRSEHWPLFFPTIRGRTGSVRILALGWWLWATRFIRCALQESGASHETGYDAWLGSHRFALFHSFLMGFLPWPAALDFKMQCECQECTHHNDERENRNVCQRVRHDNGSDNIPGDQKL